MAISNKLTKLQTDITSAYTAIADKGGTIPAHKNTDNLATAIDSISSGPAFVSNGFANDSWETIAAICDAGLASFYYKIGDSKTVTTSAVTDTTERYHNIPAGWTFKFYIVSFNTVNLTNGTKGHMTLMASPGNATDSASGSGTERQLFYDKLPYAYFSYAGANIRDWLNVTFKAALPNGLKNNLKTMKQKIYNNYSSVITDLDADVTLPNLYQLGCDYIHNRFSGVNNSYRNIRSLKFDQPLMYFSDYNKKESGFDNVSTVHITSADTCENWKFTYFTLNEIATESPTASLQTKDSSWYVFFLPIVTI